MVNARTAYLNMSTAIAELYGKNGVTADMVVKAVEPANSEANAFKNAYNTLKANDGVKDIATVKIEAFANEQSRVYSITLVIPTTGSNKFEITGMTYEEGKKRVVMENSVWKDVETISLP